MYRYANPNPKKMDVGDCAIRAISLAVEKDWEDVYIGLCVEGALLYDLPNSNNVWGSYLTKNGWIYNPIKHKFNYNIKDFCSDHPKGIFIVGTGDHAVCISDGMIYDTWDSSSKIPLYYFYKEIKET